MILSQSEIRAAVSNKEIRFDPPLLEKQFGEASVDLRLGNKFTKLKASQSIKLTMAHGIGGIADSGLWQEQILPYKDDFGKRVSLCLEHDDFVLALTHEHIYMPRNLIAMIEGRSTYARVGLSMHQTAPWIQPGWDGHITLEIRNSGPLNIELTPELDMPCQLTFFRLTSEVPEDVAYGSRPTDVYKAQSSALPKSGR
ncbi:MAG: dCTP deaminase [Roseiarcus sp.]